MSTSATQPRAPRGLIAGITVCYLTASIGVLAYFAYFAYFDGGGPSGVRGFFASTSGLPLYVAAYILLLGVPTGLVLHGISSRIPAVPAAVIFGVGGLLAGSIPLLGGETFAAISYFAAPLGAASASIGRAAAAPVAARPSLLALLLVAAIVVLLGPTLVGR